MAQGKRNGLMTQRIDCEVIGRLRHYSSPSPAHTKEKIVMAKNTCLGTLCGRFAPPTRFFFLASGHMVPPKQSPPNLGQHPSHRQHRQRNPRQILDSIPPIGTTAKEIPAKPSFGQPPYTEYPSKPTARAPAEDLRQTMEKCGFPGQFS